MADIENQKYFLQLLVYNNNKKQNLAILKEIDNNQYTILKDIANDVLDEIIPLNSQQYKILVQYKTFIRKLGREKVSKSLLTKNLQAIKELAKLIINGNETCEKTNASSCRRMGKNKKATFTNKSSIKCGSGTITTDEESDEIWEQYYNEQKDETED